MVNWDKALAYQTAKFVRVQDKRLGLLHYFFMFLIFVYIIVYVLLINKRYMSFESPTGLARLNVKAPEAELLRSYQNLSYCVAPSIAGQKKNGKPGAKQLNCQYRDEYFTAYPQVEHNCLLLTTRYSFYTQTPPGGCNLETLAEKSCMHWNPPLKSGSGKEYFLAQPENFTLSIDHSFIAPQANKAASSRDAAVRKGVILGEDGTVIDPCDDYTRWGVKCPDIINVGKKCDKQKTALHTEDCRDIIPIMTLLRAAGVNSLDTEGDYVAHGVESYRYSGLVLQVNINYENNEGFDSDRFHYHYQVTHVKKAEYKGAEVTYADDAGKIKNREIYDRHGVRLVFTVTGNIGHFDKQTLLIQLVTSMGLFAGATVLVDKTAQYFMRERKLFSKYKYQDTPVFTQADVTDSLLADEDETDTSSTAAVSDLGAAGYTRLVVN